MHKSIINTKTSLALVAVFAVAWPATAGDSGSEETVRYSVYPDDAPRNSSGAASASPCRDLAVDWPSPFTNVVAWSDGLVPHRGPVYVAGKINDAATVLWTPIQSVDTTYDMFKTLELEGGCTLCIRHWSRKRATFEDLRITGDTDIWGANVEVTELGGKVWIADDKTLSVSTYNNRKFEVHSEISGNGDLQCITQIGTSSPQGIYRLYGMNTNFHGKVLVSMRTSSDTPAALEARFSTLVITNALNLGGALDSFAYDALKLRKKSKLYAAAPDIVLAADSNRGILIGTGDGRIDVPEASGTLTVNWPLVLTTSVHFYKEGGGHLVLGNTLRFLNKNGNFITSTAAGTDCTYNIDIREGTVAVTDSHAMDGAYIAFSNDTAFVMSVGIPDGDLKTYGLRCDKTRYDTPLATTMPIRLRADAGARLTERQYLVSLVTVKSAYADDVEEKLSVVECPANYKLVGISRVAAENVASAVTFKAEIVRKGFVISFK